MRSYCHNTDFANGMLAYGRAQPRKKPNESIMQLDELDAPTK